ncbi:MAG: tryptophan-rich sensory protein [Bacteroidota bacterium]
MNGSRVLQLANILGLLLVLTVNTMAVTLPIGGLTTGEISGLYPNLFVPAGYAFSIWSLIYILLIIFVILQAKGLFGSKKDTPAYVDRIGWWFFVSCLANAGWILVWHFLLLPISMGIMLFLLFSLIQIYRCLDIDYDYHISTPPIIIRLPFSIYMGWVSVATIANASALLISLGWHGGAIGPVNWTVIMLTVATLLGLYFVWVRQDVAYGTVLAWALIAILVKRKEVELAVEQPIVTEIYVLLGVLALFIVVRMFKL